MALEESALSELLDALRDRDGGVDLVRELADWALQQLIEAQATEQVGAARHERTEGRATERNGHRPRTVTTKAIRKTLQGASWQRCRVHYVRNLLAPVPKAHQEMVARGVPVDRRADHPRRRRRPLGRGRHHDRRPVPKAAALMDSAKTDVLAFTAFPREHWHQIWTNNPLERLNKEIRRRTSVVGIFPTTPP